jgi:hypothetical protein
MEARPVVVEEQIEHPLTEFPHILRTRFSENGLEYCVQWRSTEDPSEWVDAGEIDPVVRAKFHKAQRRSQRR